MHKHDSRCRLCGSVPAPCASGLPAVCSRSQRCWRARPPIPAGRVYSCACRVVRREQCRRLCETRREGAIAEAHHAVHLQHIQDPGVLLDRRLAVAGRPLQRLVRHLCAERRQSQPAHKSPCSQGGALDAGSANGFAGPIPPSAAASRWSLR